MADISTLGTLFHFVHMVVLSKKALDMVPRMVAHLHTVLRLQQRAGSQLSWLDYDIQFRMELAASADGAWKSGDPWQYIACLPNISMGQSDPFTETEPEFRRAEEKERGQ